MIPTWQMNKLRLREVNNLPEVAQLGKDKANTWTQALQLSNQLPNLKAVSPLNKSYIVCSQLKKQGYNV